MRMRLNSLQFLRFLAFLGVFMVHESPHGGLLSFSFLAAIGFSGVSFFTVLSGFVSALKLPFMSNEITPKKILKYLWKKLKQFYPLYIILLTARFIYHLFPLVASGATVQMQTLTVQYVRCALLIETWIDHSYFELTGAAWFMSVIFFLYILEYPLLGLIGKTERKHGRKGLMILLVCVIMIDFFLQYAFHIHAYTSNPEYWNYVFPPARTGEYLAGMTACRLIVPYFREKKGRGLYTGLEVIGLCTPVVMAWFLHVDEWLLRAVIWMIPSLFVITVFSLERGWLSGLFDHKPFIYLGNIEFECYLLHEACILAVSRFLGTGNILSVTGSLFLTVLLSSAFYEWKIRRRQRKMIRQER